MANIFSSVGIKMSIEHFVPSKKISFKRSEINIHQKSKTENFSSADTSEKNG